MTRQQREEIPEAQAQAKRFLEFVDNASQALFPGVKCYADLTEAQKVEVRAVVIACHQDEVN